MQYFNESVFDTLKSKVIVTKTGVTCGFCEGVFKKGVYDELMETFPDTNEFTLVDKANSGGGHKRFYTGPEYVITRNFGSVYHMRDMSDSWKGVLREVASKEFMERLSEAVGVEFNTICNFGFTYGNEGCVQEPHLDGAIRDGKTSPLNADVAFLLYFNEKDEPTSATEIYDIDRETILLKGSTMRNSWVFFKQHPNSWHGFPRVPAGHTRKILSLTFTKLEEPLEINWSFWSFLVARARKFLQKI